MTPSDSNKSNLVYYFIIFLLLGGVSFLAYKWSETRGLNEECNNTNALIQSELDDLESMLAGYVGEMSNDMRKDLQAMLQTYDDLIDKDASKADSINAQKQEIENLIVKLNQTRNISARELGKLKKENETLKGIMRGYVKQIDSLYTMTQKLSVDLDETSNALNMTKEERDNFKKEAQESSEKIKIGSKLRAYNLHSGALRLKLNNTTEATDRSRKAYQLFSSFTLQENLLSAAGNKTIYLQISDPNGKIYMSSGANTTNTQSGLIQYSDKKTIEYNNQALDVAIYYDLKGENAEKGKYRVKLYCEGVVIGEDNFILK